MSEVTLGVEEWAEQQFGSCELGDRRRTRRLVKLAIQAAGRPDGSTPDQTETWADCKAAYRLFDADDVTFEEIIAPHCQQTRADCGPGSVKLILNDTTEVDFGMGRKIEGLGPTGNGYGRGFFLQSALMIDQDSGRIEGLAGQTLFYRQPKRKGSRTTRRRSGEAESTVWRDLFERIGSPPAGVRWIHICDRGADDYEVFCQALRQKCGFVVRAAKLNRWICTPDGRTLSVSKFLAELPADGEYTVEVGATKKRKGRVAVLELRHSRIGMPRPRTGTPWIREHAPTDPIPMSLVELREVSPPKGEEPLHWVLYSSEPARWVAQSKRIIEHYRQRPIIEDYHKALKTGCRIEDRQYETAARLERVTGLQSVLAVRLVQLRTAAREEPDRPAREVAPVEWVALLQKVRGHRVNPDMTIYEFVRALAGLGGHLGRKRDGEPGWITLWRGLEKLQLIARGAKAARRKCG